MQELLLATTHEISQIVINDSPETKVTNDKETVVKVDESIEENPRGEEARAVVDDLSPSSLSVEALKKGLMRKKETEDAKKQKSKVPRK